MDKGQVGSDSLRPGLLPPPHPPGVGFDHRGSPPALSSSRRRLQAEEGGSPRGRHLLLPPARGPRPRQSLPLSRSPLPPRRSSPHTVICVTDPGAAGGREARAAGRGEGPGPPASSPQVRRGSLALLIGHVLASISPTRRSDWQKAHFWSEESKVTPPLSSASSFPPPPPPSPNSSTSTSTHLAPPPPHSPPPGSRQCP